MTTIPAKTIHLRRIWRDADEIEPIHFQIVSGDATQELELTRETHPALYDFIEANAPAIPSDRSAPAPPA